MRLTFGSCSGTGSTSHLLRLGHAGSDREPPRVCGSGEMALLVISKIKSDPLSLQQLLQPLQR
jgi:hypothetical protein